jgi:hypothetical protein
MNIHSKDPAEEQAMRAHRATCSKCKGAIIWGLSSGGKSIPVDASPVGEGVLLYIGEVKNGKAVLFHDRFYDAANKKNPGKFKGYVFHDCSKRVPYYAQPVAEGFRSWGGVSW